MRTRRFLVAASAVVIAYTLVQIVLGLMARSQSKSWAASSFRSALITFAFDQVRLRACLLSSVVSRVGPLGLKTGMHL